ncbi:hypothetical protein GCM10022262_34570 [Georgenia daeguensis]|uniref:Uncharacterized protein n=1 Tax=Georgenia daeguensis TaxID=908355 RepID=A0ABP8EYR9_9MICO
MHEDHTEGDACLQTQPEPAPVAGACEEPHPHRGDDREARDADERVRHAEGLGLRGLMTEPQLSTGLMLQLGT